jgi:hypothetical protein
MIAWLTRRLLLLRVLRAVWRYRGRILDHGDEYQMELATALQSKVNATFGGRFALGGYRIALRVLVAVAIAMAMAAIALALLLWQLHPVAALLALVAAVPAALLGWWRLVWGAPLDWLDRHADPTRSVPLAELPDRLLTLAGQTRSLANVPGRLADELEALAADGVDHGHDG